MAMIKCKECGKEMSDHAIICPNCGCENSIIFCLECNKQLSSKASICPNCGCPVKKNKHIYNEEINSFCLSGMIIGIVSFFIDFFGLVSATGLIISIIGLSKSSSGKNKCFAIIGIACSTIELILKIIQLYNLIRLGY
jgi:RNA polymerase subunit RPABC4/transcription elongation factor Spt4